MTVVVTFKNYNTNVIKKHSKGRNKMQTIIFLLIWSYQFLFWCLYAVIWE